MGMPSEMGMMRGYRLEHFEIGTPRYNNQLKNRTVSLISDVNDKDDNTVGRVEVVMSFDKLISQVINAPWWKSTRLIYWTVQAMSW